MDLSAAVTLEDLSVPAPPPGIADWNDDGVVILERFLDPDVAYAYLDEWRLANGFRALREVDGSGAYVLDAARPHGWDSCTPYLHCSALRRIVCDGALAEALTDLIGPCAVNLNLTGLISTERDWHQDQYLNPPNVGDAYAAVWIALGDVHPDSGPFQYVPGSHRWPQVTHEAMGGLFDLNDPAWPRYSERVLSPLFEAEIERRDALVVSHVPKAGDVLIWHPRLLHRGSRARLPHAYRPGLIAHYSGLDTRAWPHEQDESGGRYFMIEGDQSTMLG